MLRSIGQGCLLCALLISSIRAEDRGAPAPPPAAAFDDSIPWRSYILSHVAAAEPIDQLLREFAADQGVPLVVSEKVEGNVSGDFGPLHPREFLDEVTRNNGLVWYYDGSVLYVYRSDEVTSKVLPVRGAQLGEVLDALEELGVLSDRFPVKTLEKRSLLYVAGPPRYLEIVTQMTEQIQQQAERQASVEIVMEIFPLQYAWADNQAFILNGTQVVVPGVATILNNLINGEGGGGTGGQSVQQMPNNLPTLRGTGLIAPYNQALFQAAQSARNAELAAAEARARADVTSEVARQQAESAAAADSPEAELAAAVPTVIQADPRLNAVVIRDVRERMEQYREIIRDLDRPSGLVQIEASIIDVDADSGFEWSPDSIYRWLDDDPSLDVEISTFPIGTGPDPNVAVSLGNAGVFELIANLRALETQGQARLVSRPAVLTINNVEATLTSQEEFFVRVEGFENSDLFNVNVGTKLRIVPHIVNDAGLRKIKLIVTVEDGRRTEDTVDTVPIISRNTINTQAVLNEGNSLLIGGLIREEMTKAERRLPILGRIPVLKHAVTSVDQEKRRFERIVLITPKIIDLPECGPDGLPLHGAPIDLEGFPPATDPAFSFPTHVEQTSGSSIEGRARVSSAAGEAPAGKLNRFFSRRAAQRR